MNNVNEEAKTSVNNNNVVINEEVEELLGIADEF